MKTIIVTDPCYILTNRDWDGLCKKYLSNSDDGLVEFRNQVQKVLRIISGDEKALADDTGYGDWVNSIDGQMFYADSGMVCVVEYTDKLKKYLEKEDIMLPTGVAYVETGDDVTYRIDRKNPEWSRVIIHNGSKIIISEGES